MLIIPAIDLKDGYVVRYVQGKLDKKVYSKDPLKTTRHWIKSGAKWLHIVDLDGAFSGTPKNLDIVKKIAKAANIPIQCGGGIRDLKTIKNLLDAGIWRVVLGTRALEDRIFLKNCFAKFKDKIIISIDANGGKLMTNGWKRAYKGKDVIGFARELKSLGFNQAIYTDTLKDGTLSGPNIKGIKGLLRKSGLNIIASGGISSLDDILKLKKLEKQGLIGVIIGKALYEGRFTLQKALAVAGHSFSKPKNQRDSKM
ncbi:MAG: 1-(5-phosphoribosyl)-5-[(5-phosphoribosylamino)methylideneamino]imidazole-4-carboxamide isomerase [Candidatus Omnitrophota bacterium]